MSVESFEEDPHETAAQARVRRLRRLLADARVLQDFAISSGRAMPKAGFHTNLSQANHNLGVLLDGGATASKVDEQALAIAETAFREHYDQLTTLMAPVCADSIRATRKVQARRVFWPSVSASAVAIMVFIAIVVMQGYWAVSKRYVDQWRAIAQERHVIERKRDDSYDALAGTFMLLAKVSCVEEVAPPGAGPQAVQAALARAKACERVRVLTEQQQQQVTGLLPEERALHQSDAKALPILCMLDQMPAWTSELRKACADGAPSEEVEKIKASPTGVHVMLHRYDMRLEIIQSYLVPALLGLLGALIFILRDLGTRLKTYAYTPESIGHGFSRLVLAFIAGVLGGWFMPTPESVAKSVPPLIIPFMLGYAVEIFFGLLDRATRALSSEPARPT